MFVQATIEEIGEEIEKEVRCAYPDQNSVASLVCVYSPVSRLVRVKGGLTKWAIVILVDVRLTIRHYKNESAVSVRSHTAMI